MSATMTMSPRILYVEPLKPGERAVLSPEETHHLIRVLRSKVGDEVALINGRGSLIQAKLVEASPKRCVVEALCETISTSRPRVHLVFGIPKSAAIDFIVHRATELGVASFQPLVTQNSLPASHWNAARWQRVIAEVAKQCQELFLPELLPPKKLGEWLTSRPKSRHLVFCDEESRESQIGPNFTPDAQADVLVGAEGGWSREEAKAILEKGSLGLGLGKNRLRAETAALVALTLLKQRLGEI